MRPLPSTAPAARLSPYDGDRSRSGLERLNAILETSDFAVHVARTFTLDEIESAHHALRDHYVGKLALQVATDGGVLSAS